MRSIHFETNKTTKIHWKKERKKLLILNAYGKRKGKQNHVVKKKEKTEINCFVEKRDGNEQQTKGKQFQIN